MLTDTTLRNLKGAEQPYKVADRDGLYVTVSPSGGISFRYNYRVNGRQETLTLGRYGVGGMTLSEARDALAEARKVVREGGSPARMKDQAIQRRKAQESFSVWVERWLDKYKMAESTRAMRRWTYERDLKDAFGSLLLSEITDHMLRALCDGQCRRLGPDCVAMQGCVSCCRYCRRRLQLLFSGSRRDWRPGRSADSQGAA